MNVLKTYNKAYLSNVFEAYKSRENRSTNSHQKYRLLGAIEATLIFLGVFKPGAAFEYKVVKEKRCWWFGYYDRKETYPELIVRYTEKFLKNDLNGN